MANLVKTLKRNSLIKGIDISSSFYERLSSLVLLVAQPESLISLKEESPAQFEYALETLLILMATLDEAAEKQGLVEESALEDSGIQNPDAG